MARLAHGYTNDTRGDGRVVVKRYEGPDRDERRARERMVLARLQGLLPVPALLDSDGDLRMRFVAGVQGQELIDAGAAARVLRACGRTLRDIHGLDVARILPGVARERGAVLVHGDYGPNNVLLDPATFAVTAVLDWEWARPGSAVEDLAWCEWIVRMHHGAHVPALDEFFDGYGSRPAWARRRDAMLAQCRRLLEVCERWSPGAVRLWQHRLEVTAGWLE